MQSNANANPLNANMSAFLCFLKHMAHRVLRKGLKNICVCV